MTALSVISKILGWTYFTAWSVSFYPQLIENYRNKSVTGVSIDYFLWNITGYTFYTIYNIYGYIFQHKHKDVMETSIEINDVAFSIHGTLLTIATCYQIWLWRAPERDKISQIHVTLVFGMWVLAIYNFFLAAAGFMQLYRISNEAYAYSAIQFLGFCKSFVTAIKYLPQILLHWSTKTTKGFAIDNILLDFAGGLCSFMQMFVKVIDQDSWAEFSSNVPKLITACLSMFYCIVIMFQHYVLYRKPKHDEFHEISEFDSYVVEADRTTSSDDFPNPINSF